jgi:hypothetical protein
MDLLLSAPRQLMDFPGTCTGTRPCCADPRKNDGPADHFPLERAPSRRLANAACRRLIPRVSVCDSRTFTHTRTHSHSLSVLHLKKECMQPAKKQRGHARMAAPPNLHSAAGVPRVCGQLPQTRLSKLEHLGFLQFRTTSAISSNKQSGWTPKWSSDAP